MPTVPRLRGRDIAALRRRIDGMRQRSANLLAAWQAVTDWFAEAERLQWSSRGLRWRTPWRDLRSSTLADKARQGHHTDILVRDRTLMRSLSHRPLSIERLGSREMAIGTRVPYAHFHQRGTTRMPARPLLDAGSIAREGAVGTAVLGWIVRGAPRVPPGGARR